MLPISFQLLLQATSIWSEISSSICSPSATVTQKTSSGTDRWGCRRVGWWEWARCPCSCPSLAPFHLRSPCAPDRTPYIWRPSCAETRRTLQRNAFFALATKGYITSINVIPHPSKYINLSYALPLRSWISCNTSGLRVTIPLPRGRKSLKIRVQLYLIFVNDVDCAEQNFRVGGWSWVGGLGGNRFFDASKCFH